MSFEGYHQVICKNGHYSTLNDIYSIHHPMDEKCEECQADIAWYNIVDDTNLNVYGIIPDRILKICYLKVVENGEEIYYIPGEESKLLVHIQHDYSDDYVPLHPEHIGKVITQVQRKYYQCL